MEADTEQGITKMIQKLNQKITNKVRVQALIFACLVLLITSFITSTGFFAPKGPVTVVADEDNGGTFYEGEPSSQAPIFENVPSNPSSGGTFLEGNSQAEPYVIRNYSECAGGPGMVQDVEAMSDGTYRTSNQHFQSGACGDIQTNQSNPSTNQSQPYIIRSYPECAGSPGQVRDVDAMSDGTYRTYNQHFQSGACGDNSNIQPQSAGQVTPIQQPIPITAEDYQCEGGNKVFYRVFVNITRSPEKTGRVEYNSPSCTSAVFSAPQGSTYYHQSNSRHDYPALSASCQASPSLARVGEGVSWQVLVSGGSGNFKYDFSGDLQGQSSYGSSVYIPGYQESGRKQVEVKIKDQTTDQKVTTNCAILVTAQQTPIPTITPQPTITPIIQNPITPVLVPSTTVQLIGNQASCPVGTIEKSRSATNLVCERPNPQVTTINSNLQIQCPSGTVEKNRNNGIIECEKVSQATVVISTPTPQPVQLLATTTTQTQVQCPVGTIEKSRSTTELICERQIQTTIQAVQTNIQKPVEVLGSQTSSIKELPKTGLPLVAIGFTALTPLGIKLRRMLKLPVVEESAQDIWLKRQMGR
jgi:hypothetical protein